MTADPDRLEIYCLDVGQGDCTILVPPEGEGDPILFDCADAYVAERFFANHGMKRLEAVIVSHLDIDHVRGVLPFLRQHFEHGGEVGQLVIGLERSDPGTAATDLLDAALEWDRNPPHKGFRLLAPFRFSGASATISKGKGWRVDLVLPFYGGALGAQHDGDDPNMASAVLRIERKGAVVLVGGDAPLGSWERLEEELRAAHTIRIPHHGGEIREGGEAWADFSDLYDAVRAEKAIISVGTNNTYGHPLKDHIQAARRGTQCRILCTQMTTRCHKKPVKVRADALRAASGIEYPYRHHAQPGAPSPRPDTEVPCAGTVLVSINATGTVYIQPRPKAHESVIELLDHPMCTE